MKLTKNTFSLLNSEFNSFRMRPTPPDGAWDCSAIAPINHVKFSFVSIVEEFLRRGSKGESKDGFSLISTKFTTTLST